MRLTPASARNIALWLVEQEAGKLAATFAGPKVDAMLDKMSGMGFYLGADDANPQIQALLQKGAIAPEEHVPTTRGE